MESKMLAETLPPPPTYVTAIDADRGRAIMFEGQALVILGEEVVHECRSYRHVRRYVKGKHPHLGLLHRHGWSGDWETIWELDVIKAQGTFEVTS